MKDKFFDAAKAVAMTGNGVGGSRKTYRLGAVLVLSLIHISEPTRPY